MPSPTALRSKTAGPTVAVLAGGIDQVYPRENAGLAERILEHGCLVSEYPVGIPARPDYFPRRNRILSGLARATLLVEAGEGSGTLHTANWAFEQGRDVFAIPGSIFSRQSWATNQLIRESTAKLVATPAQLCEELNLLAVGAQMPFERPRFGEPLVSTRHEPAAAVVESRVRVSLEGDEGRIVAAIDGESAHIDAIARASGLPIATVSATLQILELQGIVRASGPMTYVRV